MINNEKTKSDTYMRLAQGAYLIYSMPSWFTSEEINKSYNTVTNKKIPLSPKVSFELYEELISSKKAELFDELELLEEQIGPMLKAFENLGERINKKMIDQFFRDFSQHLENKSNVSKHQEDI